MAKPRVIIADEDSNYIIPLQYKFVDEFFDKIDLEVISNREYFVELFSKPQNVDVLIVSEELYESSLRKHNICNIFVMSENQDEVQSGDLNVNKLFKYTSIKEIYIEVVGKSAEALSVAVTESKETQIVLVTSAAGGVGKTTVAMGVAASLAKSYKRVLYINASRLQCFDYWLNNRTTIVAPDVYMKLISPSEHIYNDLKHVIRNEMFSYLPAFRASLLSIGVDFSIYEKIAVSAKNSGDFDYIIIDAESTFDEEKNRLTNLADTVLVITEQTLSSVLHTNLWVTNTNGIMSDKYIFVCNKFDSVKNNALIKPDILIKFSVTEYIEKYEAEKSLGELTKMNDIQRVTLLIM